MSKVIELKGVQSGRSYPEGLRVSTSLKRCAFHMGRY